MNRSADRHDQKSTPSSRAGRIWLWAGLLLCCVALPAEANRIVQVRVGNHPSFTRLVFEMEAPTGYRVERSPAEGGGELLSVTLAAGSRERDVHSKSLGIESVRVEAGTAQSVALIQLRKSGLPMKELILSNPPRIVLDFVHETSVAAPAPKSTAKTPTVARATRDAMNDKSAETTDPKLARAATEVAAPVRPSPPRPAPAEPTAKTAPQAALPKVVAAAEPAVVAPMAAARVAAALPNPPSGRLAAAKAQKTDETLSPAATDAERRAALRARIPGVHKRAEAEQARAGAGSVQPVDRALGTPPASPVQEIAAAKSDAPGQPGRPKTAASPAQPNKESAAKQESAAKPKAMEASRRVARTKSEADSGVSGVAIAAVAAGVVLLMGVGFWLIRRRSIPVDLDITAFAESAAAEDPPAVENIAETLPSDGQPIDTRVDEALSGMDTVIADAADESPAAAEAVVTPAIENVMEKDTAAYSLSEVAGSTVEPQAEPYNEDPEGEKAMDLEMNDLPTHQDEFAAPPPMGAAGQSDVAQLVRELSSRIASLETRLDESNDARERLERQVAAQSEELRVQRAAIARTQRALRSLSRSEEDQATEPALRDPAKPASSPA